MITSNRDFNEWPLVFANPLMTSATMDRLVHRAVKIIIEGKSYSAWTASCAAHGNCRSPWRIPPRPAEGPSRPSSRDLSPGTGPKCAPKARTPGHIGVPGPTSLSRVAQVDCPPPPPADVASDTPAFRGALSPVGDVLESELVAVGYREQPVQPCSGRGGRGFTEPAMESESGTRLTADSVSTFEPTGIVVASNHDACATLDRSPNWLV